MQHTRQEAGLKLTYTLHSVVIAVEVYNEVRHLVGIDRWSIDLHSPLIYTFAVSPSPMSLALEFADCRWDFRLDVVELRQSHYAVCVEHFQYYAQRHAVSLQEFTNCTIRCTVCTLVAARWFGGQPARRGLCCLLPHVRRRVCIARTMPWHCGNIYLSVKLWCNLITLFWVGRNLDGFIPTFSLQKFTIFI